MLWHDFDTCNIYKTEPLNLSTHDTWFFLTKFIFFILDNIM